MSQLLWDGYSISERERKMGLSALINYWCIHLYHKCKVEYIELGVVKIILINVIIGRKKSN